MRNIKIIGMDNKLFEIKEVDEYVSGFKYFYIRFVDGRVITIDRDIIKKVLRTGSDNKDKEVFLKKIKYKEIL